MLSLFLASVFMNVILVIVVVIVIMLRNWAVKRDHYYNTRLSEINDRFEKIEQAHFSLMSEIHVLVDNLKKIFL